MIIKINCQYDETCDYKEIMEEDKMKVLELAEKYKELYDNLGFCGSFIDYLLENNVFVRDATFFTIEI